MPNSSTRSINLPDLMVKHNRVDYVVIDLVVLPLSSRVVSLCA
jgi:hypothetical protein